MVNETCVTSSSSEVTNLAGNEHQRERVREHASVATASGQRISSTDDAWSLTTVRIPAFDCVSRDTRRLLARSRVRKPGVDAERQC